jgi:hypothetical protein
LNEVKAFHSEHGRLPAESDRVPGEPQLDRWVQRQRWYHDNGWLAADKVAALSAALGDGCLARKKSKRSSILSFTDYHLKIASFVQVVGRLPKSKEKDAAGAPVGTYVYGEKQRYNAGNMPQAEAKMYEAIPDWGWQIKAQRTPVPRPSASQLLMEFVITKGRFPSIREAGMDPRLHLGQWVKRMRSLGRQGKLSPEDMKKLEGVPGWFWDYEDVRSKPTQA